MIGKIRVLLSEAKSASSANCFASHEARLASLEALGATDEADCATLEAHFATNEAGVASSEARCASCEADRLAREAGIATDKRGCFSPVAKEMQTGQLNNVNKGGGVKRMYRFHRSVSTVVKTRVHGTISVHNGLISNYGAKVNSFFNMAKEL
ncbi:MAG: hypothetical protein Q4G63_08710 [Bacteroidia bacterium]|nr:hypothetical protein [Bacteroidia bacterium]